MLTDVYTITQASDKYQIPRETIQKAAQKGRIYAEKFGKTWILDAPSLDRWAEGWTGKPGPR